MDWTSIILGLAGITATLIASGIGHYFTYKDRNSGYREELYKIQIENIVKCFETINKLQKLMNLHHGITNQQGEAKIWEDLSSEFYKFSNLVDRSSAVLPTDIYIVLSDFNTLCEKYIDAKNSNDLSSIDLQKIQAKNMKFALLSRQYLGVDELSDENLRLTTEGNFTKLLKMEDSTWVNFAKELSKINQK